MLPTTIAHSAHFSEQKRVPTAMRSGGRKSMHIVTHSCKSSDKPYRLSHGAGPQQPQGLGRVRHNARGPSATRAPGPGTQRPGGARTRRPGTQRTRGAKTQGPGGAGARDQGTRDQDPGPKTPKNSFAIRRTGFKAETIERLKLTRVLHFGQWPHQKVNIVPQFE